MPFKKGNKHGHRWKPGESGNKTGRPKLALDLRADAKIDAPAAYATIRGLMLGADKDSVRLAAAVRVLQVAGVAMGEPKAGDVNVNVTAGTAEAAAVPDDQLDDALLAPSVN